MTGVTVKPDPFGSNATSMRSGRTTSNGPKIFAEREKELQMFSAFITVMLTAGTIFYMVTV